MSMDEKLVPKRRFVGFTDNWECINISELAEVRTGKAFSSSEFKKDGEYLVVTNKNVQDELKGLESSGDKINISKKTILHNYLLNGQNVLVTMDGVNIGKTGKFSNGKAVLAQRVGRLTSNQLEFVYQITQNIKFENWMNRISIGNAIKHISLKQISEYSFFSPISGDEQQRIGEFFANLDGLIASQQRKLNKTKAMKSAYLSEMFPADGESKPKRRFSGFTDDWEQGTIGDFGSFHYGKSAPKWSVTQDATTPCVRYGELYTKYNEKIDTIYSFTNIPKDNLRFSTGKEVLVPRVGEDPLDFANCSWISIPGVAIGEMISVYNTKQNPLFTAYMFNTLLKKEFAKRVEGGNVSNLYYTYLENISVSYPSIEEQEKISSFFDSLSNNIASQQQKLDKLKDMKKAYLNEMFI